MKPAVAALLVVAFFPVRAQSTLQNMDHGYYVVVASYGAEQESFAKSYSEKLNVAGRHCAFGFDPVRRFIHVYIDQYSNFDESIHQMLKARNEGFQTAWVRIIKGSEVTPPGTAIEKSAPSRILAKEVVPQKTPTPAPAIEAPVPVMPAPATINASPQDVVAVAEPPAEVIPAADPLIHPKLLTENTVVMTLFNPTNQVTVEGDVEIVEGERARLITRVKSEEPVMLPDPKNKTGILLLKASAFGYRPIQHEINYKATAKDSLPDFVEVNDNHYRFRFEMIRLHRGDIAVLYNVYFFNDAAIMIPDSKYELNKLLELMNSNKNYRIKLHGHTNGNGQGKIISLGESKNFFSLSSDVKTGIGSAKELSRQRAETIRDWLISNSVAPDRIEVQAHGGSRMIHDKNSANARRNVRVEVEMLSE